MSRYLANQHWRSHNAAEALAQVRVRMRGQVEPSNEHSAWLYSQHVLASDDEFGAQAGLVVQGDELAWTTIDVLFDFATFGHAEHVRQCHADGEGSQLCTACQKAEPLGQIWLVS